ncbi:MAG: hypothetical protein ACQESR_06340 [Planctomycetota bacterium]
MKLSRLSGKRIALIMPVNERGVVLRGRIELRRDPRQGVMLEVTITGDEAAAVGAPVFWVSERRWKRQLASGMEYGCDYLLDLQDGERPRFFGKVGEIGDGVQA